MSTATPALRPDLLESLTAREFEVLCCLALAASNSEIADAMDINVRTVESHIAALYLKLGLFDPGRGERRVAAALLYLESCALLDESTFGALRRHPAAGRLIRRTA
jgi:DNA-binding CsgD family transcriptional regulator